MLFKYKINEVAKDFGCNAKEIMELLEKYLGVQKKNTAALEENELDLIFDYFTQKNQVDNLDDYFSSAVHHSEPVVEQPKPCLLYTSRCV